MPDEISPEVKIFSEAKAALASGDKGHARDLLTRLLKTNKNNADFWLLMSAAVESSKERIFCLNEVQRVDPQHLQARRGLAALGGIPPDDSLAVPLSLQKRNWEAALFNPTAEDKGARRMMIQAGVALGLLVLLTGGIIVGILANRNSQAQAKIFSPTLTYGPTVTYEATSSPVVRSPTPTFIGPTPLWMLLPSTYTPTPVYVNTPHNLEDYTRAQRMMKDGNWSQALLSLQNAITAAPTSADLYYLAGDAARLLKKYSEASQDYTKAIQINANFAPPYLGLAQVLLETNPKAVDTAQTYVEKAISLDPKFFEACLQLADIKNDAKDGKGALKDLAAAAALNPASPQLLYERARAELLTGSLDQALADAQQANQSDLTFLPGYQQVAEALIANDRSGEAQPLLETYTRYVSDDKTAFLWLGEAYVKNGILDAAQAAFDQAIKLDNAYFDARLQRGLFELDQNNLKKAYDDLRLAWQINPNSFPANLALARYDLANGDLSAALTVLDAAMRLAQTDLDKAGVYYYRAQVLEGVKNNPAALQAWQALLKLSPDGIPAAWLAAANQRLAAQTTPSLTTTLSLTPRPSLTPTR